MNALRALDIRTPGLPMRQLTEAERAALTQPKDFELYLETVREMEGGVVYAICPLAGSTPRALKVNLRQGCETARLAPALVQSRHRQRRVGRGAALVSAAPRNAVDVPCPKC